MTLLDTDTIAHLDFDAAVPVPCFVSDEPGVADHDAAVVGTQAPCGHAFAFCGPHAALAERLLAEDSADYLCAACAVPVTGIGWQRLVSG